MVDGHGWRIFSSSFKAASGHAGQVALTLDDPAVFARFAAPWPSREASLLCGFAPACRDFIP
jgi:hypothetical protein